MSGISIDQMASEIMKGLTEYADIASDAMKKAVKDAGKLARDEIKNNAPKDTGAYAKSWANKTSYESSVSISVTVYSKNRYQIAHLLEHGHAKRGGGRVSGRVHIAPAEDKAISQLEDDIKRALEG